MNSDDEVTPPRPTLSHVTSEPHTNGKDPREERRTTEMEQGDRLEFAVLEMHGMIHAMSVAQEAQNTVVRRELITMRADLNSIANEQRRLGTQFASQPPPPPMRNKLDSVSDLDEDAVTENGTTIFRGTHEQMERLIDARAEARYVQLQQRQALEAAAAPVMFLKGNAAKFVLAACLAAAGSAGAAVWAFFHSYFQK